MCRAKLYGHSSGPIQNDGPKKRFPAAIEGAAEVQRTDGFTLLRKIEVVSYSNCTFCIDSTVLQGDDAAHRVIQWEIVTELRKSNAHSRLGFCLLLLPQLRSVAILPSSDGWLVCDQIEFSSRTHRTVLIYASLCI